MESRSREPAGTYVVSDIDELRALLDSKRVVILRMLAEESLTVKQLADRMGLVPASVHYHVKVLERSGLVALVDTKEKSGILEKYYRSIAREFQVDPSLGSDAGGARPGAGRSHTRHAIIHQPSAAGQRHRSTDQCAAGEREPQPGGGRAICGPSSRACGGVQGGRRTGRT